MGLRGFLLLYIFKQIPTLFSFSTLLPCSRRSLYSERERDMEETKSRFNRICVFCGSSSGKKASYQEAAVELGKELVTLKSLPPSLSLSLSLSLMDFIKSLSQKDQYFMEVHAFFNTFLNFYFFSDPFLIQNAIRVFYLCLLSLFW